jgi:phage terminase large subunit
MLFNKRHSAILNDESRFLISFGGSGSGKSFSVAQKLFIRLVSEESHRILVARKVARTLRVSVFQLFKDIIAIEGMSDDFHVNKTDMTITYTPNGNQLLFFGLDDIEKLKSIQGITSIWVEEASECEENDIAELNRRLRGHTDSYKQIIITFNPISHLHWLKARFFDNENANASIYLSTYKDNAFIDEEYKSEIESLKHFDIQQYNIYALGEWGVLNQNKVYHCYDHNKHATALSVNDFDVLHCGVDFNVGGCAVVVCGIKGASVYVVTGSALYDTDAVVTYLMKFNRQRVIVYPDASGGNASANAPLSSIEIIRRAGFYVDAQQINPAIRDRVNAVNRLFAQGKLFVGFEKISHALQTQAYDESGKPEKSKSHAGGAVDDWNDALGYFISRKFPVSNKINNLQIKGI